MARFIAVVTQTDSSCQIPNGWVRYYHTNGNLSSKIRFINGMIEGPKNSLPVDFIGLPKKNLSKIRG
jgi:antitoxin component YwqK of YwqJK toxin-antitoxin module